MLVKGVPSMHICIGFLPELFKIATLEQRIFGIRLLGHLAHQYSIPRTLEICKLALHIGLTLSQGKMSGSSSSYKLRIPTANPDPNLLKY